MLNIRKKFNNLENEFACFYEKVFIFFLKIRTYMLMKTHDPNIIFFSYRNNLI